MNAVAEVREEYKSAVRKYIRQSHSPDAVYKRVEFYEGRMSGLEVALGVLGVGTDEVREMYNLCEEETLDQIAEEEHDR
jgi:hypothetical protein